MMAITFDGLRCTESPRTEEETGMFSDDTGFFSAAEDLPESFRMESPDILPRSPIPPPYSPEAGVHEGSYYPILLKKYLDLSKLAVTVKNVKTVCPCIDFDELCQVLALSGEHSGLRVAAQLLDLAMKFYNNEVEECHQFVNALAEEQIAMKKRSNSSGTSGTEPGLSLVNEVQGQGTRAVKLSDSGRVREEEILQKKAKFTPTGKSFVMDNSQISLSFMDVTPDVVGRRTLLKRKFHGLVKDELLDCEFDIHRIYETEGASSSLRFTSDNHCVSSIVQWLGQRKKAKMILPTFTAIMDLDDDEDDNPNQAEVPSSQESGIDAMYDSDIEDLQGAQPNNINADLFSEFLENHDPVQGESSIDIIPESGAVVESGVDGETKHAKGKWKEKSDSKGSSRKRSTRIPFEPLSPTKTDNSQPNQEETDEDVMAAKRSRMEMDDSSLDCDSAFGNSETITMSQSSQNDACVDFDDATTTSNDPDPIPDQESASNNGSDEISSPRPVYDPKDNPCFKPVRLRRINMKALISKFEDVVLEEVEDNSREEVPFEEIVMKSKINIQLPNEDSDRKRNVSSVSVAEAFLACLHIAPTQHLYLKPTEDESFKITKVRPSDHNPNTGPYSDSGFADLFNLPNSPRIV